MCAVMVLNSALTRQQFLTRPNDVIRVPFWAHVAPRVCLTEGAVSITMDEWHENESKPFGDV